jgi:hypothetical protein
MLEDELRDLFTMQASADLPPQRVSLPTVRRKAAARRRRRDIAAIGSPILAACAVLAIALAGALPAASHRTSPPGEHSRHGVVIPAGYCGAAARAGSSGGRTAKAGNSGSAARIARSSIRAPRQFDVAVPYASFGWLPKGECGLQGATSVTEDRLQADHGPGLQTFAYGVCQRSTGKPRLSCPSIPGYPITLHGRAPAVNGHAAYLAGGSPHASIVWQYAPHGWAVLSNDASLSLSTMVRIAGAVDFGGPNQRPLKFAVQVTSRPAHADGLVIVHDFYLRSGALLAETYAVFHPGRNQLGLTISVGGECSKSSSMKHVVINGHDVEYWSYAQYSTPWTSVCVSGVDGLRVILDGPSKPSAESALTVVRHLKILGANPDNWVRQPIS